LNNKIKIKIKVSVSNNTWRVPRPDWIGINHGFGSNVQQYTAVFDIRFDLSDTSGDVRFYFYYYFIIIVLIVCVW